MLEQSDSAQRESRKQDRIIRLNPCGETDTVKGNRELKQIVSMITTMTETQSQVSTHSEPSPEPMVSNPEATVSDSQPLGEAVMLTDTQTSESVVGGSVTPITVATNLQGNLQHCVSKLM